MPDIFIVKNSNNSRFDKWFKEEVINIPNSLIQKLLRTNKVKVNNKRIKSSLRLKIGDKVTIRESKPFSKNKKFEVIGDTK